MTSLVLNGDNMVRNRIYWIIGEQSYIVYYPIITYQNRMVYRVETIDENQKADIFNKGLQGQIFVRIGKLLWGW